MMSTESMAVERPAPFSYACLTAAAASFAWAVTVAATGGFTLSIGGVPLSSHRIVPAYLIGTIFLLATAGNRQAIARLADRIAAWPLGASVAVGLAAITAAIGILFGTFTSVGDAFGYIAQADLWIKKELFQSPGPVLATFWPDAASAFCPLGFRPAMVSGTMVPTYAAGLPLLMAAFKIVFGAAGPYLVVPASGALAVYLTFRLGRIWMDRTTGLMAAALLAASPVFLLQLVQPMSDVAVTAWWLLALVAICDPSARGAVGAGLAASVAILIRPNLAPLAAPLAAWAFVWPSRSPVMARIARVVLLGTSLVPLTLLVAWIQFTLYGSPFTSGYGRASDIYALGNFLPNLSRYPRWLVQTHTPFVVLGLAAPVAARWSSRDRAGRPLFAWLALSFVAAVFLCYAFYMPFDHWGFLRFMLPALPVVLTLSAGALITLLRTWTRWCRTAIALAGVLLVLLYVQAGVRGEAFSLRSMYQERFRDVGTQVGRQFPANAAFISLVQTSSVSYYAHRQTIRYEAIAPSNLDRAVKALERAGYKPYLLLMAIEIPDFQRRFAADNVIGRVRCAPRLTFGRDAAVRLFDVDDCVR